MLIQHTAKKRHGEDLSRFGDGVNGSSGINIGNILKFARSHVDRVDGVVLRHIDHQLGVTKERIEIY